MPGLPGYSREERFLALISDVGRRQRTRQKTSIHTTQVCFKMTAAMVSDNWRRQLPVERKRKQRKDGKRSSTDTRDNTKTKRASRRGSKDKQTDGSKPTDTRTRTSESKRASRRGSRDKKTDVRARPRRLQLCERALHKPAFVCSRLAKGPAADGSAGFNFRRTPSIPVVTIVHVVDIKDTTKEPVSLLTDFCTPTSTLTPILPSTPIQDTQVVEVPASNLTPTTKQTDSTSDTTHCDGSNTAVVKNSDTTSWIFAFLLLALCFGSALLVVNSGISHFPSFGVTHFSSGISDEVSVTSDIIATDIPFRISVAVFR